MLSRKALANKLKAFFFILYSFDKNQQPQSPIGTTA